MPGLALTGRWKVWSYGRMIRVLILVFCALLLGPVRPVRAERAAPAPSGLTAEQARTALEVLTDPAKRAAFAATLNAIIKAQPPAAAKPQAASAARPPTASAVNKPAASAANKPTASGATKSAAPGAKTTSVEGVTIPLAPDSLGAEVLESASTFVDQVGNRAMMALNTVQSLPLLYGWAVVMVTNPVAKALLADVIWRVAVVLLCAIAAEWGLRRLMRKPVLALERLAPANHAPQEADPEDTAGCHQERAPHRPKLSAWTLLRRVPLVLARLGLELVPVVGLALVGHLLTASAIGGQVADHLIILAVIDAYAACAALLCVVRMLLSPSASRLRLFSIRTSTATYLMRWARRLILLVVIGYAAGEVGLLLGMSAIAHDALQKAVGLALHICMIVIVLRNKRAVRRWLRAPEGAADPMARLRNAFARVWHWIALFFLVAGWLVWAVEVPHGYAAMLHYFILTALMLIGARLALLVVLGVVDRTLRAQSETEPSGLQGRLRVYHPVVSKAMRLLIYVLCALGLLQLYGLNTFLWLLESPLGNRLLSAVATLTLTVVFALAVWEVVNSGFQQHLDRLQRQAQVARSARLRTLLPLLRTSLMITLSVVAALMMLSEIGINVAPLLAGAGIVGVAIGFGSQKLVQDLITGIFLLLENAMQVGDWVTVSGLSGSVENLSVRTIRLRAADGSVHIIPFSSVTSVTNVNRGLGNAAVSVTIDFEEDVDRAEAELKAIIGDMRRDPDLSAKMLSDFQLWGVDKMDGASVTITGQVVCTDSGRWPVQREINRRIKERFQKAGIGIYNPQHTLLVQARPVSPPQQPELIAAPAMAHPLG
jgi:small-conductance mechanosensitive channel